jgi:tetratricopeptide (TPR) repeat protein
MLFSYPLQNLSIRVLFAILMALISAYHQEKVFTINLSGRKYNVLRFFLLIVAGFFLWNSMLFIVNGFQWKQAHQLTVNNKKGYLEHYRKLYPVLKHNRSFLLNYGSMFYKAGRYKDCIDHFENYGYLTLKTDMLLMLGDAYEKTGDNDNAEETYLRASFLVPHKFIPRYKLFRLYKQTGQTEKAYNLALNIKTSKIKVYSDPVKHIKTQVNEYLLLHPKP